MKNKVFFSLVFVLFLCGCARLHETGKVLWGSSTKALEEKRSAAASRTYQCFLSECFDEVVSFSEKEGLTMFIKDKDKNVMVVMGLSGTVSTTEIGIFFEPLQVKEIRVDVVSLSTKAQEMAADLFLKHLDQKFQKAE